MFQFIVVSREQYVKSGAYLKEQEKPKEPIKSDEKTEPKPQQKVQESKDPNDKTPDYVKTFQQKVQYVMQKLNEMLQSQESELIGAQGNLLKYMTNFFDHMVQVFDDKKAGELCKEFVLSIPAPSDSNKNLMENKLSTFEYIIKGEIFKRDGIVAIKQFSNIGLESRLACMSTIVTDISKEFTRARSQTKLEDKTKLRATCVRLSNLICKVLQELIMQRKKVDYGIKVSIRLAFALLPQLQTALEDLRVEVEQRRSEIQTLRKEQLTAEKEDDKKKLERKKKIDAASTALKVTKETIADTMCAIISMLDLCCYDKDTLEWHLQEDEQARPESSLVSYFLDYQLIICRKLWKKFSGCNKRFSVQNKFSLRIGSHLLQ